MRLAVAPCESRYGAHKVVRGAVGNGVSEVEGAEGRGKRFPSSCACTAPTDAVSAVASAHRGPVELGLRRKGRCREEGRDGGREGRLALVRGGRGGELKAWALLGAVSGAGSPIMRIAGPYVVIKGVVVDGDGDELHGV